MPSHKLLPVFTPLGHGKASLLTAAEVRGVVTAYVKANNLVSPGNSRYWSEWVGGLLHLEILYIQARG